MSLRGTRGMDHHNRKLSVAQVRQIYKRANEGEKQEALAIEFGINQRTVSAIKLKKRWKCLNLEGDIE